MENLNLAIGQRAVVTARRKQRTASEDIAPARARLERPEIEASYPKLSRDLLRRARWKHGLSKEDASDIVQEAFLVALLKTGSVSSTRAWLGGVVDHLALNLLRTGQRRAGLLARWGPSGGRAEEEAEEISDEL